MQQISFFCGPMVFCQEEQNLGALNYKFECLGGGGKTLERVWTLSQNSCCRTGAASAILSTASGKFHFQSASKCLMGVDL